VLTDIGGRIHARLWRANDALSYASLTVHNPVNRPPNEIPPNETPYPGDAREVVRL